MSNIYSTHIINKLEPLTMEKTKETIKFFEELENKRKQRLFLEKVLRAGVQPATKIFHYEI